MKKRLIACAAAAAATVCLWAPTVSAAKLIAADDPAAILEIAKGYGRAELAKDADGDPTITGRMSGTRYTIFFYGCVDGAQCGDIQFVAAWSGYKISLRELNTWNQNTRYGKAYLDTDDDPALEVTVNLKHGVTVENLDDTFDWWKTALEGFEKDVLKD